MKKFFKFAFIPLILIILFIVYFYFFRTVGKNTIPVITYHSIQDSNEDGNEYIIKTESFEEMVKGLKENNFTFLSLSDVEDIVYNGKDLPEKPVLITLDDGYKDNYTNVYPIIKKYDAHASIFLIGSKLDSEGFLSSSDVIEMAESGFIDFGSHSYNLHDLFEDGPNKGKTWLSAKLDGESDEHYFNKIKDDLIWNNNFIYERSSVFPTAIAYPGAMVNDIIIKASKEAGLKIGFVGANKTASKIADLDPYEIKRFNIRQSTNIKRMVRFLSNWV